LSRPIEEPGADEAPGIRFSTTKVVLFRRHPGAQGRTMHDRADRPAGRRGAAVGARRRKRGLRRSIQTRAIGIQAPATRAPQ
jgi:hypothetical protein